MEGEKQGYTVLIWLAIISVTISLLGCGDEIEVSHENFEITAIVREPIGNVEYINLPGVRVEFTANKLPVGYLVPPLETLSAVKITNDDGMCDWSFGFDMRHADIEGDVIEFDEWVVVTVYASRDGISDTETIEMLGWDMSATAFLYLDPNNPSRTWPPSIDSSGCNPIDKATNVDPYEYLDGLKIAFDKSLSRAEITSTEPEFDYTLTREDKNLKIEFLDYTMPHETSFEIEIIVADLYLNTADVTYSFATMAKVER